MIFLKKAVLLQHCQPTVFALGIGHGFSDAAAGYLMGSVAHREDITQMAGAVILYNLLAFGGQLPAGMWLDRIGQYRAASVLSLGAMMAALFFSGTNVWIFTVLAGISSAFFHVAGGAATLISFPQKSVFVGLFSAFGVLGLALGGWAAAVQWQWGMNLLMMGLCGVMLFLVWAKFPSEQKVTNSQEEQTLLDTHDYLMIFLLAAIAMRSAVWNCIQLVYTHQYEWLVYIALAAMAGKLVGGWLADRIGVRLYTLVALSVSIPTLSWGYRKLFWLLLGTGLLQSVTPVSVMALHRIFPKWPAAVSGATFGLAIAVGGVIPFPIAASEVYFLPQLILAGVCVWSLYFYAFKLHKTLYSL